MGYANPPDFLVNWAYLPQDSDWNQRHASVLVSPSHNCSILTSIVFDCEIWVVQHLWDEAVFKVMSLYGIVLVDCTDGLDHLWKHRQRGKAQSHYRGQVIHYFSFFITKELDYYDGSHKVKNMLRSFQEFEIIINGVLSHWAHFRFQGSFIYLSS